jgi:hypothetical protein
MISEREALRLAFIISLASLYSLVLMKSIQNLIILLSISGLKLGTLSLPKLTIIVLIDLITTLLLMRGFFTFLIGYLIIYTISALIAGNLSLNFLFISLLFYFLFPYVDSREYQLRWSITLGRKGVIGALLIILLFWFIYRTFIFSDEMLKRFVYDWLAKSSIDIKEFYLTLLNTVLGKIIFISVLVGISSWIALEIGGFFKFTTLTSESAKLEIKEFIARERKLVLTGKSSEDRSLLWGTQLAISLLLYPYFLTLAGLYEKYFLKSFSISPQKLYLISLILLYLFSLFISRYIAKLLINVNIKSKPVKGLEKPFSALGLIKQLVLALLIFVLISYFEGVDPLKVLLNALGVKVYYEDPLANYIKYMDEAPAIVNNYMIKLEYLLNILIKLFLGG